MEYRPAPWIFWVRIAQAALSVIIIALGAYAASQTWIAYGVSFSIWAVVWTLIYVPLAIKFFPTRASHMKPLLTVLILDVFTAVWWLISFALLVDWCTSATFVGYKRMTKRDHYSDLPHCYSDYDQTLCTKEIEAAHQRWLAAARSTKASAAFAGVTFILCMVCLHMTAVQFNHSRRRRIVNKA